MPLPRAALLVASVLAGVGLAGCSEADPGPVQPEWVEAVVPAGSMLDLEYSLTSGATLHWTWETADGRPLAFQVLQDNQGRVTPMFSGYSATGEGERTAPRAGRYDLTWDNKGSTEATVRFIVLDGYRLVVWPAGQGPGCEPLVLAGVC